MSGPVWAQAVPRGQRPGVNQSQQAQAQQQGNGARRNITGQQAQNELTLNYRDVPLVEVIEAVMNQLGKNYELAPELVNQAQQTKVTLVTHAPIPPELIDEMLESLLSLHDYTMVETLDGNLYKIIQQDGAKEKRPLGIGVTEALEGFERFSTHIVPIRHADAGELQEILQQVSSDASRIDVYAPTNTLILSDTADGIRKMFRIIQELDRPGYDTEMDIFALQYANATELSAQIQEVLMGAGGGEGGQQPGRPSRPVPQRTVRPNVAQQAEGVTVGSREEILRMVPDERLNTLIVVASAHLMDRVRDLIDKLDTPTPFEQNVLHYVPLLNADAEAVAGALGALVGTAPRAGGGGQPGGGAQTAQLQPFEKEVIVEQYEQANALMIVAAPQDFKLLQEIIAQLDVPQRQVVIETHLLQVTINDNLNLAVETAALASEDVFALGNVVNLANFIANPLSAAGLGVSAAYIDGTTELTLPTGVDDSGQPTGFVTQEIPNVPLLFRALETLSDVDVLSEPSLTTVDNEEASIIVGQEVPIISTLADVNDRTGFLSRSRVEREDVGVQMTVTPQINEGDYVLIDTQIEISEVVDSAGGIDPTLSGPTFDKSEIQNLIVVPDGATGVIGGLISNSRNRTRNQIPILGDLPLLGFFFRNKNTVRRKRNLVALITPYIVKERQDMERVTEYKIQEFYNEKVDALFEKGFIRKVRGKYRARNKESPSDEYREQRGVEYRPRGKFGRSNIE